MSNLNFDPKEGQEEEEVKDGAGQECTAGEETGKIEGEGELLD